MPSTHTNTHKGCTDKENVSSLSTEAEKSAAEVVGPPQKKKKKTPKGSSSKASLNFDQFTPAMQKHLMKQALKSIAQSKDADAESDAGTVHPSFEWKASLIFHSNSTN